MSKNVYSICLVLLAWFSVITQFYLMMENRIAPVGETIIRFFSFFTILTNSLVALYFTSSALNLKKGLMQIIDRPGTLTAVTVYITMVGLVYQVLLRHVWQPQGLQLIVDELLHSIIPILVIVYWFLYGRKKILSYKLIAAWLSYPLIYLVYVLVRGSLSGFYPYPFVDADKHGLFQVMVNSLLLILLFVVLSAIFVFVGRMNKQK